MPRPVLDITIGSSQNYTGGSWGVDLFQQEYAFDVCVLRVPRVQATSTAFAKDTPVQVTYGRTRALLSSFPAYVHHVDLTRYPKTGEAGVICIGASAKQLRSAANREWPVGSASSVAVQQIATKLHLSSLTQSTDIPAPGGPVNESWWRYIQRAARSCGFTCYAAGTDIRFHARRIDASGDPVSYFISYGDTKVRTGNVVQSYRASDSDDSVSALHRQRRAFGVTDEGLPVIFTDIGDLESVAGISQELPSLIRNESMVVHDIASAASRLSALQEQNRFSRRSKFVVSGDETVRQGSTIVVRGIRDDLDGYWYVSSVTHNIKSSAYTMTINAGRDSVGDIAPANLGGSTPVIALGRGEPEQAPASVLRVDPGNVTNLVFPTPAATWTAASLLQRQHHPWRAAVRG